MTELTDTERGLPDGCICAEVAEIVGNHLDDGPIKAICDLHTTALTARLARVEALAERIDAGEHLPLGLRTSMLIRAALAAPTPDEVQP